MSDTVVGQQLHQLLSNASATGAWFKWKGGAGTFTAKATGYGAVKLEMLGPDGVTALTVGTDTTLTADGGGNFELGPCMIRANVATATAVYAQAFSHE